MDQDAEKNETPGHTASCDAPASDSGVLEDALSLWRELLELSHDRFRLAALETQRAGESLVAMIMVGVMIAVLLSGAWLGLMAAAVAGVVEYGVMLSSAILLAVAANFLLVLILCGVIRRNSRYLQFPATLRSLQPSPRTSGSRELMIKAYSLNSSSPESLTAQIRHAERQVLKRRREVGVRADRLVRKIHQQMTSPATLLLEAGIGFIIGFIIGEITKRQSPRFRGDAADKPSTDRTTPLRAMLNLVASVHTFYRALPLVWMMKSFPQPGASAQAPGRRYYPTAAISHR